MDAVRTAEGHPEQLRHTAASESHVNQAHDLDYPAAGVYVVVVILFWLPDWSVASELLLPGDHSPVLSLVLLLLGAVATVFRRRFPALTLVATGLSATAAMLLTGEFAALFLQFEAIFSAVLYGSRTLARAVTAACLTLTTAAILAAALASSVPDVWFGFVVQVAIVLVLPLLWAWEVRHHREARNQAELAAHSQQQLALRERELAQARSALQVQEHGRGIAQDLHDGVAGHLSAIALQTAALRTDGMRQATPEQRDAVLESVRVASVAALAEMRSLIDVLRYDTDPRVDPQTSLDNLQGRLHASFPAAGGTSVEIDRRARELLLNDANDLAPAVLRIAQEAVTNVLKHAVTGPIHLSLRVETLEGPEAEARQELTLLCVSPLPTQDGATTTVSHTRECGSEEHGEPDRHPDRANGAGLGLRSMSLRAQNSGGEFAAGANLQRSNPAVARKIHAHQIPAGEPLWVVFGRWPLPKDLGPRTVAGSGDPRHHGRPGSALTPQESEIHSP